MIKKHGARAVVLCNVLSFVGSMCVIEVSLELLADDHYISQSKKYKLFGPCMKSHSRFARGSNSVTYHVRRITLPTLWLS